MSHGTERTPERPYFLYVGGRANYKNFEGLLRIFARIVLNKPDLALAVAGKDLTESERRLIGDLKISDHLEYFIDLSDQHLAKLYRCSLALVYPSLYEGFGIPPLEAMSCSTVAVVSNVSSLPEVVGDAGVLFDPKSPDELSDILITLAENEAWRQELIEKGRKRVEQFRWDKTAAQTVEVYRSLAG
jgi:glycosyltransferase involved in cell wall biosynthesis